MGKVAFPLSQTITASSGYKTATFSYVIKSFSYIIRTCGYSLSYTLNKFSPYAKEIGIGSKETYLYVLERENKEVRTLQSKPPIIKRDFFIPDDLLSIKYLLSFIFSGFTQPILCPRYILNYLSLYTFQCTYFFL